MVFKLIFKEILEKKTDFKSCIVFIDENNKIIKMEIIFANLILSGEDNSLYYFDKRAYRSLYKMVKV